MKFNNNDGASALEESATPPSITICMVEVHIGMILSVLLRILIQFAIVCLSIQMMIDPFQSIFTHAEHPALRQSSNVSSGNAQQRFPHDSIDNCGDDLISKTFWSSSIHKEPVPASPRQSSRNERGASLPPADNEPTLSALTASESCSSMPASTSWIRDNLSSLSMTCKDNRETTLPADHDKTIAPTARICSCASANICAANHGSTISWFMRVCTPLHHHHQERGAVGENFFRPSPQWGQPSTTHQSTFPSAVSPSSQSHEELITLRFCQTSPANENTTSSTTQHEFGLIAQVTTSELISLYVNSPCTTVDVLSGNEYFATLSTNASSQKLIFTTYSSFPSSNQTSSITAASSRQEVFQIAHGAGNDTYALLMGNDRSQISLVNKNIYNLYWPEYTPGGSLASIIFSKVLPIEDPSLTVCLTVIAPSAILFLDFILSTKTLVRTYDSVIYLNEFPDQKGLHLQLQIYYIPMSTNQATIHDHICFRLFVTNFVAAATNEVTTGSVSFNQLCDNISVLFAITYFASEFFCILSSRIFSKSLQISPDNIPDLHAMAAKSFQDIFNATSLYSGIKVVYYIATNILLQIYAIHLFIFFRVDDNVIEPSGDSNHAVNEIGTYDTFGIIFLHDVTGYIFNAFEIFFLHDVIAYHATTHPEILVSSLPVNPIHDSLLTWYAIYEKASAPMIHQTKGLIIFDLHSVIPLPQSPRLLTWCNKGLSTLCTADTANGTIDYTTIEISAHALIFTTFYLWTATIIMVVVFVLRLLINPMTKKVGMVRVWTGLGEILDVRQINLLGRPIDAKRTSVSAYNTNMNDIFVSTNSSSSQYSTSYYLSEYYKVMQQHFGFMGLIDDD